MAQKWKQSAILSKHSELGVCLYSIRYVGNINLLAIKSHTYFSCGSKEFKRPITLIFCDAMTSKPVQIFHRKIPIFPFICDFPYMKSCDQKKTNNTTFDLYFYSESKSDASLSIPLREFQTRIAPF